MANSNKKYNVKKSKIQGDGAFAKQNLNPGDYVGKVHTIIQPYVDYEFTELGRKHNHSDNPNVQNVLVGNKRHLVAVKPIKKGEELKSNYRLQPDLEQPEDFQKTKNSGWLDKYDNGGTMQEYQENYNDSSVSMGPGFVGEGTFNGPQWKSPAWGGQFAMGGSIPGSVGFTYARTQGIPSEGKYAKKTLPSAQNGKKQGNIVSDWWYNLDDVQGTYKMYNDLDPFLKNWYQNPETQKRLKENLQDSLLHRNTNPSQLTSQAINTLQNTPAFSRELVKKADVSASDLEYNNELQGWKSPSTFGGNPYLDSHNYITGMSELGSYDPDTKQIIVNSFNLPGTIAHEGVHGTPALQDAMEDVINWKYGNKKNPKTRFSEQFGTLNWDDKGNDIREPFEKVKSRLPGIYSSWEKTQEYLDRDGMYPRIMDIRRTLNLKPGEKVDKSILENQSISHPLYDLKHYYDDDTIIDMLNKLAKNNSTEKPSTAQNGEEMKYYQEGLDWKPKNISRNGGWLDVYDVPQAQKGKKLPTIFTSDKNDKRLKAYKDSIGAASQNKRIADSWKEDLKEYVQFTVGSDKQNDINRINSTIKNEVITDKKAKLDYPKQRYHTATQHVPAWKNDHKGINPVAIGRWSVNSLPLVGLNEHGSPYASTEYPIYGDPVQPVEYRPETKIKSKLDLIETNREEINNTLPAIRDIRQSMPTSQDQYEVEFTNPYTNKVETRGFSNPKDADKFYNMWEGNKVRRGKFQDGGFLPQAQNGLTSSSGMSSDARNCRGKSWRASKGSGSQEGEGMAFADNSPVTAAELVKGAYDIKSKKQIKQYTQGLQEQYPGVTEEEVAMAMSDSNRLASKQRNLESWDQTIKNNNVPFTDKFFPYYRPLIKNATTPVTAPQIFSMYPSVESYRQTVNSNFSTPKYEDGGDLPKAQPGKSIFKAPTIPRNVASSTSVKLPIDEMFLQEVQQSNLNDAVQKERFPEAWKRQSQVGPARVKDSYQQQIDLQRKKQYVDVHPNVEIDDNGRLVPKNTERDFEGRALPNTRAARTDKGLDHIMTGLEAAGTIVGVGSIGSNLLRLGAGALEKKIGRNLVSKGLKNFTSRINPGLNMLDEAASYVQLDPIGIMGNKLNSQFYNPTVALNTVNNTLTGVERNLKNSAVEAADVVLGENNLKNVVDVVSPTSTSSSVDDVGNIFKPISDKEKEMYDWFKRQQKIDNLPQTRNKQSLGALEDFKIRIQTPEGKKRLKELGIDGDEFLQKLDILEDPNTFGYYAGDKNKIVLNPLDPLSSQTVRHEIEHGVQNALKNSKIKNSVDASPAEKLKALESSKTEIDDILSGLELRKEGTPGKVWDKSSGSADQPVDVSQYRSLLSNKQKATDYFLTGSEGREKSAFLGEVQQYMMDKGIIPKNSYTEVTPKMVHDVFADAMFDETGGGKYLRLFNIMKASPKNYDLISKGLNKMLTVAPAAVAAKVISSSQPEQKKKGGVIKDNRGQWDHPGEITEIQGNNMATHGYGDISLYVVPNVGRPRIVDANTGNHVFPGATKFTEYPIKKNGGWLEKYS